MPQQETDLKSGKQKLDTVQFNKDEPDHLKASPAQSGSAITEFRNILEGIKQDRDCLNDENRAKLFNVVSRLDYSALQNGREQQVFWALIIHYWQFLKLSNSPEFFLARGAESAALKAFFAMSTTAGKVDEFLQFIFGEQFTRDMQEFSFSDEAILKFRFEFAQLIPFSKLSSTVQKDLIQQFIVRFNGEDFENYINNQLICRAYPAQTEPDKDQGYQELIQIALQFMNNNVALEHPALAKIIAQLKSTRRSHDIQQAFENLKEQSSEVDKINLSQLLLAANQSLPEQIQQHNRSYEDINKQLATAITGLTSSVPSGENTTPLPLPTSSIESVPEPPVLAQKSSATPKRAPIEFLLSMMLINFENSGTKLSEFCALAMSLSAKPAQAPTHCHRR